MILGQAAGFEESAGKPRASGDDPVNIRHELRGGE